KSKLIRRPCKRSPGAGAVAEASRRVLSLGADSGIHLQAMADGVHQAAHLMRTAHRTVALTGAGLSTESGIPDFRSPGGVWERFRPIEYQEFLASHEARIEHWRYKQATVPVMLQAEPN